MRTPVFQRQRKAIEALFYRVSTDGVLHLYAGGDSDPGGNCSLTFGDGAPATNAQFSGNLVHIGLFSGTTYVVDQNMSSIRSIDATGLTHTVVGMHCGSSFTSGAIATATAAGYGITAVTASADGQSLYYGTTAFGATPAMIVQVSHLTDTVSGSAMLVPSQDGGVIYQFDNTSGGTTTGQHQKTLSRYRANALATLAYATSGTYSGQLQSVTDADGERHEHHAIVGLDLNYCTDDHTPTRDDDGDRSGFERLCPFPSPTRTVRLSTSRIPRADCLPSCKMPNRRLIPLRTMATGYLPMTRSLSFLLERSSRAQRPVPVGL